jgi:phage nucleotide-binding protein|tara:strand:- start:34 stop:708 length:675 start_codon:yes stop_codon:yes gene_type:complete
MAINLQSTNTVVNAGIKMLVYGAAGTGKTCLIPTLPSPVILSAEGGLLSISDHNIPFIEVKSMDTLREAYAWLTESEEAKQFASVAIDSISEIAEVCLGNEKKVNKDPRAAYGEMQTTMAEAIRSFRDLPKHVLMTAKLEKSQDELGRMLYSPSMPGNKTGQALPYQFDIVAALRVEKDAEGATQRALMCDTDGLWQAKSRVRGVEVWESPDLGEIISKAKGAS